MCDFQVGEEIICIDPVEPLIKGKTYICTDIYLDLGYLFVCVFGGRYDDTDGWFPERFRRPIVDEIDITDKAALLKEAMVKAR